MVLFRKGFVKEVERHARRRGIGAASAGFMDVQLREIHKWTHTGRKVTEAVPTFGWSYNIGGIQSALVDGVFLPVSFPDEGTVVIFLGHKRFVFDDVFSAWVFALRRIVRYAQVPKSRYYKPTAVYLRQQLISLFICLSTDMVRAGIYPSLDV